MDKPSENLQVAEYRSLAGTVAGSELAALGSLSDDFVLACAESGEAGDAELFIHLYRDRFCFDHSCVRWFSYVGPYWERDEVNEALALVRRRLVDIYLKTGKKYFFRRSNAEKAGDEKAAKAAAWAEKILMSKVALLRRRQHGVNVLVLAAAGKASLGVTGKEWDSKPLLLPCKNGILDFQTGEFRQGLPEDYILKYCPTAWEGFDKPAPKWEAFVREIMDDDPGRVAFLQRLFGYAIAGEVVEAVIGVLWGTGRNGKSVFVETIAEHVGPLASPIPAEMLLQQKQPRSAAAPSPDIIALRGLRLAHASESGEGRRYDAGKLKWLSGADTLTGRGPFDRDQVTFKPSHTLILLTNF